MRGSREAISISCAGLPPRRSHAESVTTHLVSGVSAEAEGIRNAPLRGVDADGQGRTWDLDLVAPRSNVLRSNRCHAMASRSAVVSLQQLRDRGSGETPCKLPGPGPGRIAAGDEPGLGFHY